LLHGKIRNRKKEGWRWRRSQLRVLPTSNGLFLSSDLFVTENTLFFDTRRVFIASLTNSNTLNLVTSDGVNPDGKVSDWDVVYATLEVDNPLPFDTGNTANFIPQNLLKFGRIEGKHLDDENGSITVTNHGCQ